MKAVGSDQFYAGRIVGLDSLRLVAALWVVLGHAGRIPFIENLDRSNGVTWALVASVNSLISGPAAVIVFFVLSGFCIHYPYARGMSFEWAPFFVRRYFRIVPPMAVSILISGVVGLDLSVFDLSILWSLVAELIYYTLYPLLRVFFVRFGIDRVLIGAYLCGLIVAATSPLSPNYPSFGWQLNWLLGLPCWILGVKLADRWASSEIPTREIPNNAIWRWRLGIWGLSVLCLLLKFHSPIGYPWTLNVFAIAAFFWIDREIARGMKRLPWRSLEWAGGFSYSIYLVHLLAMKIFSDFGGAYFSRDTMYFLKIAFVLMASYFFFLIVELPAHRVARISAVGVKRWLGHATSVK